jgi:hypothetical protein
VAYYDNWGGYSGSATLYWHFPTKWISADGLTMWCIFSATGALDSYNQVKCTLKLKTTPVMPKSLVQSTAGISIQPNPCRTVAEILFNGLKYPAEVVICNINGRHIAHLKNIRENRITWNTANLSNQVYIVTVLYGKRIMSKKFIINK